LANPDLRPERGWNGELGLRRKWQGGFLEACFFRNETEDAIVYLQSGNLIKPFNMDRLVARGLEGMLNLAGPFQLGLSLNGLWQQTENLSQTYREGNAIPNQPNFKLHSQTTVPLVASRRWSLQLEHRWDWRSEVFRDVANIQRIPPLSLHHGLATFQWGKRYTLQAGCQNLTDVFYEDVYSSFPYPGRTWQTTVHLIF
jgi:outer membrane receptor protein involved in Fe transport